MAKKKQQEKKQYQNYANDDFLTPTEQSLYGSYHETNNRFPSGSGNRSTGFAGEDLYTTQTADLLLDYRENALDGESLSQFIRRKEGRPEPTYSLPTNTPRTNTANPFTNYSNVLGGRFGNAFGNGLGGMQKNARASEYETNDILTGYINDLNSAETHRDITQENRAARRDARNRYSAQSAVANQAAEDLMAYGMSQLDADPSSAEYANLLARWQEENDKKRGIRQEQKNLRNEYKNSYYETERNKAADALGSAINDYALQRELALGYELTGQMNNGYDLARRRTAEAGARVAEHLHDIDTLNMESGADWFKRESDHFDTLFDDPNFSLWQQYGVTTPNGRKYNHNATNYEADIYGTATDASGREYQVPYEEVDDEIYDFNELPKEMQDRWRFLYDKYGKEEADRYWDYLKYALDYAEAQIQHSENAEMAREDPVAADIMTTAFKSPGGVAAMADLVHQMRRQKRTGQPVNYYNNIQRGRNVVTDVRKTHAEDLNDISGTIRSDIPIIGGKGLGDVYQFGMGQVDSMINNYMTMGVSSYFPGAEKLISWIGTSVMGADAMAQGFLDAKEQGATDENAFRFAMAQGFNETLFEHVSLEQLMSAKTAEKPRQAILEILKQGFTEGSEEVSTTVANTLADAVINTDMSEIQRDIREYMQKHPEATEEEAWGYASKKWTDGVIGDFIGGAIGGILAGSPQIIGDYHQTKQTGQQMRNDLSDINARQAVRIGKQMAADTDSYRLATEIENKGIEKASNVQLGRLQQYLYQDMMDMGVTDEQYENLMSEANAQIEEEKTAEERLRQAATEMHTEQTSEETQGETQNETQNVRSMEEKQAAIRNILNTDNNVLANNALTVRTEDGMRFVSDIDTENETVTLSDGKKMSVDDVKNNSDLTALLADAEDLPTFGARAMLRNYKGGNMAEYANAFRQVAEYGRLGNDYADIINSKAGQQLNAETRQIAYAVGNRMRTQDTLTARSQGGVVRNFRRAITKSENHLLNVIDRVFRALGRTVEIVDEVDVKDADGKVIRKAGANAEFNRDTNTYRIAIDSVNRAFLHYAVHESIHDIALQSEKSRQGNTPTDYDIIRNAVIKHLEANGQSLESLLETQRKNHGDNTDEYYIEEIVANTVPAILSDEATLREFADRFVADDRTKNAFGKLVDAVIKYVHKLHTMMTSNSDWQQMASLNEDQLRDIREKYFTALEHIRDNSPADLVEYDKDSPYASVDNAAQAYQTGQEIVDKDENIVAVSREDGTSSFSMKTWEDSGRDVLVQWLDQAVKDKDNPLTDKDAKAILQSMDEIYNVMDKYRNEFATFSAWSNAEVVVDDEGRPAFSVVKTNGDYAMNLDFSTVCKKRRTLDRILRRLARDGIIDKYELGGDAIVKMNEIIRTFGFETACDLCFVDAKRYTQAKAADEFVKMYNSLVKSLAPKGANISSFNFAHDKTVASVENGIHTWDDSELNFAKIDKIIRENKPEKGRGKVVYQIALHLRDNQSMRQYIHRGDLMSSEGMGEIERTNHALMGLWYAKMGARHIKPTFPDVQYLNDIISNKKFDRNKAYSVGGVRVQSFSDFVARMAFDYMQMVSELAAKKLPAHAYTKEADFVKLFGLTGMKINMSLIPMLVKGAPAGLKWENGKLVYAWAKESFNFETAMEIQRDPKYGKNCGTIAVGVSKEHIEMMLDDPNIRMIIPYHSSGLNPVVAHMMNIKGYTDYTEVQTTKRLVDGKWKAVSTDYKWNENLQRIGDPRATAKDYLRWCEENGYRPKFEEFSKHENYYKLLEDFTLFDESGTYCPQGDVTMTLPTANDAFGSADSILYSALKADDDTEQLRNSKIDEMSKEIVNALDELEAENAQKAAKKATRKKKNPAVRHSEKVDSTGATLTEAQQRYFADSKVVDDQGRLLRVYHGTNAEFYEFDRDRIGSHGSYEGAGFNFTPSEARAGGYKGIGGGDGIVMGGYLNITNPLSSTRVTMGTRKLAELIKAIDPTGDDIIANYAQNTSDYGTRAFIEREALYTARQLLQYHKSDADIYADLSASGADSNAIIEAFKSKGYDGVIHYYDDGKIQTLIAFDSNQFKDVTNLNPTDSPDRRFSEKTTEQLDKDYMDAVERGDTETAERMVREAAKRAGYTSPLLYHGTNAFGFTVIDNSAQGADGFSFWASNKQDVSATYTGYGDTRRISEEAPDYDTLWEKANSRLNDAIHDFRRLIDRTFSEWFFGQSDDSMIYDDVVNADPEDVYEVLTDYVADAFAQYAEYDHEDVDAFADWQDSEDGLAVDDAISAIEAARQAQLELEVDNYSGGVYALYANTDNMLDLQFNGELWKELRPDALPKRKDNAPYRTRDIALWAREHGYSGVIFRNIRDNGDYGRTEAGDVYAFFNPNAQVKSADPFTYDDNGKLIPLSQRFNAENDDIRYSEKTDSNGNPLSEEQQKFFANSKVVDDQGRLLVMYHGTSNDFTVFEPYEFTTETSGLTRIVGYFSTSEDYAAVYGSTKAYYINMENPLFIPDEGKTLSQWKRWFARHGVKNVKFDSGIEQDSLRGYRFEDGSRGYALWEIFDSGAYWYGDGNITEQIEKAGYDGVYWFEGKYRDGEYRPSVANDTTGQPLAYMPFRANQVKAVDNVNPTENDDIRYSAKTDSVGRELSAGQRKYFADSKMVDDNGRLMRMYHGTRRAGFTVFDPSYSDDKASLFFTDNPLVAATYAGGVDDFRDPAAPMTFTDLNNAAEYFGLGVIARNGKFILAEVDDGGIGDEIGTYDSLVEAQNAFMDFASQEPDGEYPTNYQVYLNLKNPLIIDADGSQWNDIAIGEPTTQTVDRRHYETYVYVTEEDYQERVGKYDIVNIERAYNRALDNGSAMYGGLEWSADELSIMFDNALDSVVKAYDGYYSAHSNVAPLSDYIDHWQEYGWRDLTNVIASIGLNVADYENEDLSDATYRKNAQKLIRQATANAKHDGISLEEYAANTKVRLMPRNGNTLTTRGGATHNTRWFSEEARRRGHDGVIFKNVSDTMNGQYILSTVGIAFTSDQAKSIYNENPTEHTDYRYSAKYPSGWVQNSETEREQEKTIVRLQRENANLKNALELAKKQIHKTKGVELDQKSLDKAVNSLITKTGTQMDRDEAHRRISEMYKGLANGIVDDEAVFDLMRDLVRESRRFNDATWKADAPIRDYLKGKKIYINEDMKSSMGFYDDGERKSRLRRLLKPYITLTYDKKAPSIDEFWNSGTIDMPWVFDSEIANPQNQLDALVDIVQSLNKDNYYERRSTDLANVQARLGDSSEAETIEEETISFMIDTLDSFSSIPVVKTYADKMHQKLADTRAELRKEKREALKAMRDEKNAQITELRQENKALQKAIRDGDRKTRDFQERLVRSQAQNERLTARMERMEQRHQEEVGAVRESYENRIARHEETVQKNKFRNRIQKNVNNIYTWMAKPTDTKHVPEPIRNAVGNFIKSIDLSRTSKAGTAWRTRMDNLATQLQNGNIMREYEAFAMDLDPELALRMRKFVNNNNKSIMEMSVSELQDLSQIVSALKKAITEANWMHGSIQRQYVSEVADMSMQDFEKARKFNQSKKGKALSKIVDYNQMDAYSFFKSLGEGGMLIYNDLREGFDNFVRRSREVVNFQESVKDMLPKKALLKKHTLDINGEKVEMTTGQIMTLYELNKRSSARTHLYNGGMFLKTDANDAYSLTPELVDAITSNLTEQEKAYADRLQNFLGNVCAAWGNEASMLMYGYRKFADEHYFPMYAVGGSVQTMNNVGDAPSDNVNMHRIANLGMTKALQENATNPIIVESIETVFGRHASEMAEYSSYLAPLSDATKWFNAKTGENGRRVSYYMMMAFQRKNSNGTYTDPATQWFKNFISELNGGGTRNNAGSELWQKILGRTKAAAVGANLSVVVQQVWAYFRAYAEIDAKYMAQAFRKKPQMKLAQQYCPIAQWKAWGMFESMVSKNIEDMMSGKTTVMDQIKDKQMWLAGAADDVTWGWIWNACEAEMMDKHPNMDHTSEEFREMVGKRMSEVIDSTQVVDSIFHRPMALKNKAIQTLTAFMAEPMKSYNVLQRAVVGVAKGEQGSGKRLRNTLIGWGTAQILAAAFQSLVGAMRDDDDDETFKEKWLQKMFGEKSDGNAIQRVMGRLKSSNLADNLNFLGMHWITKYVWQGLEEIFSKGTYGSTGIDDQLVSKAKRTLQTWQKLADPEKRDEVKTQDIVLRTADIISTLTGVGAYNVIRDVWKLVNNVTHRAETPFFEQVEQDMANGDLTSIEEVVAQKAAEKMKKYPGITAEKAEAEARSDVRGDFTKNYKPSYVAAWFAGDDAEVKRIYNILLKSGLYGSQKDLEKDLFRDGDSWIIKEISERYKTTTDENERRELRELLKRCGKSTKEIKELVEKWVG